MAYLKQNPFEEWFTFLIGGEPYRYHCWHRSEEQWASEGKTHRTFGMFNMVIGMISLIFSSFILSLLRTHSLMKSSCYKILFVLGMISLFEILTMSIWPAVMLFRGGVFCNYPVMGLLAGRSLTMEWVSGTSTTMFLAFNRVADMTRNKFLLKFFNKQHKVYLIFTSIFLYSSLFALFTDPCLYNSLLRSFSINPYNEMEPKLFRNEWIFFHDIGFVVFLFLVGSVVFYRLLTENEICWRGTSDLQRKLMVHSLLICIQYLIPCIVYLFFHIFYTRPDSFIQGTHLWVQGTASVFSIVCLMLNRPLRVKFLEKIGLKHFVIQPHRRATAPSITMSVM